VWGNKDNGPRSGRYLDLRGLITADEQRQFSKVMIGAFLEATLHGHSEYLPIFRDHRVAGAWLPKTMYITRFQESGFKALATFDEDVDVTTGSLPGVTLSGDSLATWKENLLTLRTGNDPINTNAVTLGWNNHLRGDDTTKLGKPASYTIALSDSLVGALNVGPASSVYLSLAPTDAKPGPRAPAKDTTKKADSTKKAPTPPKKPEAKPAKDSTPVDLTVEVSDAAGHIARLPLSRFGVRWRSTSCAVTTRSSNGIRRSTRWCCRPTSCRSQTSSKQSRSSTRRIYARSGSCSTASWRGRSSSTTSASRRRRRRSSPLANPERRERSQPRLPSSARRRVAAWMRAIY
jgi:hypothetical protein